MVSGRNGHGSEGDGVDAMRSGFDWKLAKHNASNDLIMDHRDERNSNETGASQSIYQMPFGGATKRRRIDVTDRCHITRRFFAQL